MRAVADGSDTGLVLIILLVLLTVLIVSVKTHPIHHYSLQQAKRSGSLQDRQSHIPSIGVWLRGSQESVLAPRPEKQGAESSASSSASLEWSQGGIAT